MVFFDLNIPVDGPGSKEERSTRIKLVVKAMELGYSGIAYNRLLNGVMADTDRCMITPLPLESLLRAAPALANTIRFHREVLSVPVQGPFRQYTRLTFVLDSMLQAAAINSGNPVIRSYDLLAVRPTDQGIFEHACKHLEVDLISIDLSEKLSFRLRMPFVKAAVERGIFFEIVYSPAISNVRSRRETFANAKHLVQWTRGRNIIISSAAPSVSELRGPNDVANMSTFFGLSMEHAKAAVSKNCRSVILHGLTRKKCHKAAIQVENCPPDGIVGSDKAWFNVSEVWDPISSGEGDFIPKANLFENLVSATKKGPQPSSVMKTRQPSYAKRVSKSSNHNRDRLPPNDNRTMPVHTGLVLKDTQQKENRPTVDMRAITGLKKNMMISNANTVVEESMSKIHEVDVAQVSPDYDNRLSFSKDRKLSSLSGDRDQILFNSTGDTFLLSDGALADGHRVVAEKKSTTNERMITQLPAINCDADVEPANSSLVDTPADLSFSSDKGPHITDVYRDLQHTCNDVPLPSDDKKSLREIDADTTCNSYSQVKMRELITHDETIIDTTKQANNLASGSDVKMDGVDSAENDIHITDLSTQGRILISDADDAQMEEEIATMCDVSVAVCDDHDVPMKIKSKTGKGRRLQRKKLDSVYSSSVHGIKPALLKRKVQSRKKRH